MTTQDRTTATPTYTVVAYPHDNADPTERWKATDEAAARRIADEAHRTGRYKETYVRRDGEAIAVWTASEHRLSQAELDAQAPREPFRTLVSNTIDGFDTEAPAGRRLDWGTCESCHRDRADCQLANDCPGSTDATDDTEADTEDLGIERTEAELLAAEVRALRCDLEIARREARRLSNLLDATCSALRLAGAVLTARSMSAKELRDALDTSPMTRKQAS